MTAETSASRRDNATSDSYGSNAIRLTLREWLICGLLICGATAAVPPLWRQVERFSTSPDYRVPYALSDDYWTYREMVHESIKKEQILLIGDSVVWGEYVTPSATLSQALNQHAARTRFANGGLNGSHPMALAGLVRHHTRQLRNTHVILHCNLLWMSSAERDLQTDRESTFNHPSLVPQFWPRIPCYKAPIERRMGICIDRSSGLRLWVRHLRIRDFESLDVPSWSLEHPYANPLSQVQFGQVQPLDQPHSAPVSWTERGIGIQDMPWIDLDTSLQWQAFQQTVEVLQSRNNQIYVIVGPFNEHMLSEESLNRYQTMKQAAESWLSEQGIPYQLSTVLPSEEYGDASHPLDAGYVQLAKQIYEDAAFQRWLNDESGRVSQ